MFATFWALAKKLPVTPTGRHFMLRGFKNIPPDLSGRHLPRFSVLDVHHSPVCNVQKLETTSVSNYRKPVSFINCGQSL